MMPDPIRILEALVLDDSGSRLFDAIEHRPQCPRFRIDDRVFDPRLVLERIGSRHPIALNDVNVGAVKVSSLVQPKLIC